MPSHTNFNNDVISAETFVEKEAGQWCVYVEVVFYDEIRRRLVATYYSEKKARVAARWMRYGINIDWRPIPKPYND